MFSQSPERLSKTWFIFFIFAIALDVADAWATPLSITFTKIVDTSTPIPDGTGTFTQLQDADATINGDTILFRGMGDSGQAGLYTSTDGALGVIADTNTSIPGGSGAFTSFDDNPRIDGGTVTFHAYGSGGQEGIYIASGGSLSVIADTNTLIPSGTGLFTSFPSKSDVGGNVIGFRGEGNGGQTGLYTSTDGALGVIADTNTLPPGGSGQFTDFDDPPSINENNVAFTGWVDGRRGIYTAPISGGGPFTVIATPDTPIPGGTGTFVNDSLMDPTLKGDTVVFYGKGDNNQRGLYLSTGGVFTTVADTNTPIPDGTGNFSDFDSVGSLSNDNVAFLGYGSDGQVGIYLYAAGRLDKIIDVNTTLDGKKIVDLGTSFDSLEGNKLTFTAYFADSSSGVYTATIATTTSIKIDIKPGRFPNNINPRSPSRIRVAILTTLAVDNTYAFDATTVDPTTVRFGSTGTEAAPVYYALKDIDGDQHLDLMLHFNIRDMGIKCGETSATLTGATVDGQAVKGTDSINTVGCKAHAHPGR